MEKEINKKFEPKSFGNWNKDDTTVLKNRLKGLIELLNNQTNYPFKARVCGFPILKVKSEEDLKSRIRELSEILNVPVIVKCELPSGSSQWRLI